MSEFDEKLTILHKKFHFLEPGIISDILEQVGKDLQMATEIISTMIMDNEDSDSKERGEGTESTEPRTESDEDLKTALELSAKEDREKQELLKLVAECDEKSRLRTLKLNEDVTKKPDPPPPDPKPTMAAMAAKAAAEKPRSPPHQPRVSSADSISSNNMRSDVKDGYNLYIMRGLPGSGKSTLSGQIAKAYHDQGKKAIIASADEFFIDRSGQYNFDGSRLEEAHNWCRSKAEKHMKKELFLYS